MIPSGFVVDSETHIDDEIVLTVRAKRSSRLVQSARRHHVDRQPLFPTRFWTYRLLAGSCAFTSSPGVFAARHHSVQDGYSPSASTRPCFPFARAEPPGSKVSFIISALRLAAVPLAFAKRLMLPVSNDTLLRVVRRRARSDAGRLSVIGIDDWAFRRNHRYGTIVCDWSADGSWRFCQIGKSQPSRLGSRLIREIEFVSRDRGGGYGEAAAKALPHAIHVADRWHLFENASAAFDAVRKSMRSIRMAIGATTINPELLTCAERLQYEGYLRREEANAAIMALTKDGVSIKQIVRLDGL